MTTRLTTRLGHTSASSGTNYLASLARLLQSPTAPKLGLSRMRDLLARLGDPQLRYRVVHVAGTKGKGSTCAMTESMLRAAGLRTGLTTSPHLVCARERIVVDGMAIDEATFVELEREVQLVNAQQPQDATFFEKMIAMALLAFAHAAVDVAVVEVGLGGTLDATNVVAPAVVGISRLGIDHVEFLGATLAEIAAQKAGIIKRGVPAFSVVQEPEAAEVLRQAAASVQAPLALSTAVALPAVALAGAHQHENAALAVTLVRALLGNVAGVDAAIARGLREVSFAGRYQTLSDAPLWVADGAHNPTAAAALAQTLRSDARIAGAPLHLVVGMTQGHDAGAFARALCGPLGTQLRQITAVKTRSPRAQSAVDVARGFASSSAVNVSTVPEALASAASTHGAIVVTGSLYLVGEALVAFGAHALPPDPALPLF